MPPETPLQSPLTPPPTPVAPPPPNDDVPPASSPGVTPPGNRKKIIIIISLALLVALVATAVVVGYSLYQHPDKIVSDVLKNAMESKSISVASSLKMNAKNADGIEEETIASMNGAAEGSKITAAFNVTINGEAYSGSFLSVGESESYVKVKNLRSIITHMFNEEMATGPFAPFIKTVDNRWIRLDSKSSSATFDYNKQQSCYKKAMGAFRASNVQQAQLLAAYRDHALFKAKSLGETTVQGQEVVHIQLTPDRSQYAGFTAALKQTDAFKAFDNCTNGDLAKNLDENSKNATKQNGDQKVEIWATKWSHVLVQLKVTTKEKDGDTMLLSAQPTFNKPVSVEAPTNALTLEQVLQSFSKSLLGGDEIPPGLGSPSLLN